MKSQQQHMDLAWVDHLKEKYFCDTQKVVKLKPGEYLLKQNQENKRLFLVLEGAVAGYLSSDTGSKQEVFKSEENMFVGVHSFFSKSFSAYADVIALEDSKLAFIHSDNVEESPGFTIQDFVPVIVHELSARQIFTKDVMFEKEAAMKKLFQSEKLATLGQMAAGLAHELNNAIGVLNGNSQWIAEEIYNYFKETEIQTVFANFEKGFNRGQHLSSNVVREKRKNLEKKYNVSSGTAKKLARIGLAEKNISYFHEMEDFEQTIDRIYYFWEMGVALHDMRVASHHAVHVLNSIKQLSVADQERHEVHPEDTIREALTLLKKLLTEIDVQYDEKKLPAIHANKGELVQIWVNIIKNACESMVNARIEHPVLKINTGHEKKNIWIEITDNGPGIPEEAQKKIFRPNFTTKKGGLSFGLGLGLSIVQRLVDSYNGKIQVKSKKGETTFKIILPVN